MDRSTLYHCDDEPIKYNHVGAIKQLTASDLFLVYMEPIKARGYKDMKLLDSNVWRVYYKDLEKSPYPFVRFFPDRERAQFYFDEAVEWNGWLGMKE